ncbi:hypothetical protein [Bradyrhizobium canariense]|uniref:hypothetical protein n=1 Tax=Bradyrhizobium canariense TaxID=255045 RepID=UPI001B8A0E8B|nr:hypothetical protein [Bradyrhizobium canariense]MBR0953613.1 hypothetical protein [Bradyrhizobium canariense]
MQALIAEEHDTANNNLVQPPPILLQEKENRRVDGSYRQLEAWSQKAALFREPI